MQRRTTIIIVMLIGFALLFPIAVQADVIALTPTRDNTLYEPIGQDGFADVSNALGINMFTGKVSSALNQSGQVAVRRSVAHFDIVAAIPPAPRSTPCS